MLTTYYYNKVDSKQNEVMKTDETMGCLVSPEYSDLVLLYLSLEELQMDPGSLIITKPSYGGLLLANDQIRISIVDNDPPMNESLLIYSKMNVGPSAMFYSKHLTNLLSNKECLPNIREYLIQVPVVEKTYNRDSRIFSDLMIFSESPNHSLHRKFLELMFGFTIRTIVNDDGAIVRTTMRYNSTEFERNPKYLDNCLLQLKSFLRLGLTHGDIKPSNLMIENGVMWLVDLDNLVSGAVSNYYESDKRFYNARRETTLMEKYLMDLAIIKGLLL